VNNKSIVAVKYATAATCYSQIARHVIITPRKSYIFISLELSVTEQDYCKFVKMSEDVFLATRNNGIDSSGNPDPDQI